MRRVTINNGYLDHMSISSIIEVVASVFFTTTMLVSLYLFTTPSYNSGFSLLALTSLYFIGNSLAKLKMLRAFVWVFVLALSLKGFVGI